MSTHPKNILLSLFCSPGIVTISVSSFKGVSQTGFILFMRIFLLFLFVEYRFSTVDNQKNAKESKTLFNRHN